MLTSQQKNSSSINSVIEKLELPASAYEKARKRYDDLGAWFDRDDSLVKDNTPHIFPQGSFRLGTAIRPLDESEAYDLDLSCKLRDGITKDTHTQEYLKKLVGHELNAYRAHRGIKSELEAKHRCWRLEYQDDLSFHMDIVPCIPSDSVRKTMILEAMRKAGENEVIAGTVSQLTVSITDDRHPDFRSICEGWNISNPEGYAKWFESRMSSSQRVVLLEKAQVDDVPIYERKTPLQRVVQLLKRHRDQMVKDDPEVKPISIVITTLAARAYQGEADIADALSNVLLKMGEYVNQDKPRVPNPVDPAEDFADRWSMPKYSHLQLERNFWNWLRQARVDLSQITSSDDTTMITEQVKSKMSVDLNLSEIGRALGISTPAIITATPKKHEITSPAKPWSNSNK